MQHVNYLMTKSLFSAALLAMMSAGANAQVFKKVANDVFLHTHRSSPAVADINNDGLMDIYYGGEHYSGLDNTWGVDSWHPMGMVFINKGNSTFEGYASTTHEAGMNEDGTFKAFGLPPTIWNTTRWIDFNNDGNLDFLSIGKSGDGLSINEDTNGGKYTLLYKNGGAATGYKFTMVPNTGLVQGVNECNEWGGNMSKSSISFGDYDHDGYTDIAMQVYFSYKSGDEDKGERKLVLYKNNGDGTFTEQNVFEPIAYDENPNPTGLFDVDIDEDDNVIATPKKNMRPMTHGAVAMGDLNGDGWLDIVATGWADGDNGGGTITIYKNNGDGTFTEVPLSDNFVGLQEADIVMADFNNDGYLDFIAFGTDNNGGKKHADLYLNDGTGDFSFTVSTAVGGNGLYGSAESQTRACDLNHDGLVDIISTGWSDSHDYNNWGLHVLFQNADGTFTEQDKGELPSLFYNGGYELGHITSATSVDVFGTGEYNGTAANLFQNTDETEVEYPEAPADVNATYENGKLTITWAGDENNLGTAYNVYVRNKNTGWISMILPADTETGALKTIQDMQTALRSDDPSAMSYTLTIPEGYYEVGVSAVNPNAVCSKFTKSEYVPTGIKDVENETAVAPKVIAVEGGILVQSAAYEAVNIYNAAGQNVANGTANKTIATAAGVYLVKVGNKTSKVIVK